MRPETRLTLVLVACLVYGSVCVYGTEPWTWGRFAGGAFAGLLVVLAVLPSKASKPNVYVTRVARGEQR